MGHFVRRSRWIAHKSAALCAYPVPSDNPWSQGEQTLKMREVRGVKLHQQSRVWDYQWSFENAGFLEKTRAFTDENTLAADRILQVRPSCCHCGGTMNWRFYYRYYPLVWNSKIQFQHAKARFGGCLPSLVTKCIFQSFSVILMLKWLSTWGQRKFSPH